ncbi:MAG: DNA-deoxyinosine glycosylase [Pseudomonadota bacterium]
MSNLPAGSLVSLPPLVSADTRLLILGSFPGIASLEAQQYYGHPQNHFWKILQALWPLDVMGADYRQRSQWLLSKQLGVWDVYASCEREGSLDTSIRNAVLNDFTLLGALCPRLEAIAHNGGESFKHAKHTMRTGLPVYKLPSTSPANASWSFEKKLAAWREVFEKHGLI